MPTYEIFLKKQGRDEFRHVGALDAADDELAIVSARECYARRGEGERIWAVRRSDLVVGAPDFVSPNNDKPHRHHDGRSIAEHRRQTRGGGDND